MIEYALFSRRWTLAFTNKWFRFMFGIYWRRLLSRIGFEEVSSKIDSVEKLYYKIIDVRAEDPLSGEHSAINQKIVLLHVRIHPEKEEVQFKLSLQPCLLRILPLHS